MSELSIPDGTATPAPPAGKAGTKDDATATVTQCLTSLNVPFTTQVSEYTITQNFS